MKATPEEIQARATGAALRYLEARNALGKLATPCPVLGRDVVLWMPARQSTLAFDLPRLEAQPQRFNK